MSMIENRVIQLDLFVKEKDKLEQLRQEESEIALKRNFRAAFYRINELENVVLEQQKKLERLIEIICAPKGE